MVTGTSTAPRDHDDDRPAPDAAHARNPVLRFLKVLGPGLVTGAADDDPSGVATYAQAGATYGYGMLWTVPVALPLMLAVQEMCDRMALASGDSLGKLIRRKFTRGWRIAIGVLLAALLVANCLNLSADLMAVGQGMELLHAGPAALWSAIAGIGIVVTLTFGSYAWIRRIFKWLCLTLLIYVGVLFVSHVKWPEVVAGMLGLHLQFTPAYLGLAVGVFGTSISPYMFFWQSQERIEEMEEEPHAHGKAKSLPERSAALAKRRQIGGRVDVFTGMAFSVLVMFSIMAATAATLGAHHKTVVNAADAAKALEPIAGTYAGIFFAIGFIGSGMLAVPVLAASGASGMAALLGKEWGFDDSPRKAPVFYGLLGVGIVAGTVLAIFVNNPIQLLVLSAVVNGIAAGPFLIIMMLIARDRRIMHRYRNRFLSQTLGWIATGIMCVGGVYGVWFTATGGG
ncbi:Nramp family divalent metal transporter [Leifsonia sp. EB34]|uniref:Nramp family divalent metal transporter n=1 Tax=Leifsonia sp. EB34 TaxID=3156303 RepID=UPI003517D04D